MHAMKVGGQVNSRSNHNFVNMSQLIQGLQDAADTPLPSPSVLELQNDDSTTPLPVKYGWIMLFVTCHSSIEG